MRRTIPLRVDALRHFNNLMVDDGDRFFFQPCFSPVWDTAIGAYALAQSDPEHESLTPAADWLLGKEIRRKGDWSRQASEHRAFRLGLRILQRILSRISTTPPW